MKVILKEDLANLGLTGEVVEVKPGYARNYLIPRSLAVVASKSNVLRLQEETRQRAHKIEQQRKDAEGLAARLDGLELSITMPVGEENRLFGTVTTQQVSDLLAEKGFSVDRRKITFSEDIRVTGVYPATVKLLPELSAEVKVTVHGEGVPVERLDEALIYEPEAAEREESADSSDEDTSVEEAPADEEKIA
ncbi:MAG: 50S ribosomal protein L9 [Rubricoccaceae bacterium]|nr:50S ribosomal protein L9 [Rubricoccaceae bacterium]